MARTARERRPRAGGRSGTCPTGTGTHNRPQAASLHLAQTLHGGYSAFEMTATDLILRRRSVGVIHYYRLYWTLGGHKFESELLLQCGKERGERVAVGGPIERYLI